MNPTAEKILDAAECAIREGGFHAFSFRVIADSLEIKSASVHYHFPTKEKLVTAVTIRYAERFFTALGHPKDHPDPLSHYINTFQNSILAEGRACLCGILAAESGRLHDELRDVLKKFKADNIDWLKAALKGVEKPRKLATVIFSALEGAMIFSALSGKPDHVGSVGKTLHELVA